MELRSRLDLTVEGGALLRLCGKKDALPRESEVGVSSRIGSPIRRAICSGLLSEGG